MKIVKILICKNSLILGLFFVVTLFHLLMIMPNAYAEILFLKNENNSSVFGNLNKTTTTTTNATLENNIDNKSILIQEDVSQITQMNDTGVGNNNSSISIDNLIQEDVSQITQMNDTGVGNNNSSISFDNSTHNKESGQLQPEIVATQGNVTIQDIKNLDLWPSTVTYLENEGSKLIPLNYENNYRGISSNEDENSESRDRSSERDTEINKEVEEVEEEEQENSKDEETTDNVLQDNYKVVNSIASQNENGNKIKGTPVDNENKKLLSQFTEVNSSLDIPELQIQSEISNSSFKDSKLIANAGLDKILTNETRIVLDASSSFSSNGNISDFLWKQLGNTEEKISPSNSMIYSFPIPEEIEENPLEFELTVMDQNGQKSSDTVKISLADENEKEEEDIDLEEKSQEQPTHLQEVDEDENEENEEEEDEDENEENEEEEDDDDDDDDDE